MNITNLRNENGKKKTKNPVVINANHPFSPFHIEKTDLFPIKTAEQVHCAPLLPGPHQLQPTHRATNTENRLKYR